MSNDQITVTKVCKWTIVYTFDASTSITHVAEKEAACADDAIELLKQDLDEDLIQSLTIYSVMESNQPFMD